MVDAGTALSSLMDLCLASARPEKGDVLLNTVLLKSELVIAIICLLQQILQTFVLYI